MHSYFALCSPDLGCAYRWARCKARTPRRHKILCICTEILCGPPSFGAFFALLAKTGLFLDRELRNLDQMGFAALEKSMNGHTPLSELAAKFLRQSAREASPAATLDRHLRLQKCVSASVLASILGCSVDTIHRRRRTHGLPAHFDGGRWKFYGPEVAEWQSNRDHEQGHPEKHRISCHKSASPTGGAN